MCAVICNFLYGALVPKYVIWYHGIFFYWDSPHTSSVGDSGASLINDRPANKFFIDARLALFGGHQWPACNVATCDLHVIPRRLHSSYTISETLSSFSLVKAPAAI